MCHRIGVQIVRQVLADKQQLVHHGLIPGLRGMDTENEIAAGLVDFVIQLNREFKSDQGALSVSVAGCVNELLSGGGLKVVEINATPERNRRCRMTDSC